MYVYFQCPNYKYSFVCILFTSFKININRINKHLSSYTGKALDPDELTLLLNKEPNSFIPDEPPGIVLMTIKASAIICDKANKTVRAVLWAHRAQYRVANKQLK